MGKYFEFLMDPLLYVYLVLSILFVAGMLFFLKQIIYWAILDALRTLQNEKKIQLRGPRKK